MITQNHTVFILGAGFTKAFCPDAPLMVDKRWRDDVLEKFDRKLPDFARLHSFLDQSSDGDGCLNIERLFTRLETATPYDFDLHMNNQLAAAMPILKQIILHRLKGLKVSHKHHTILGKFVDSIIKMKSNVISFNYDDLLDQTFFGYNPQYFPRETSCWHPDSGYGFVCEPALLWIRNQVHMSDKTLMLLLKMHGSINWRVKYGAISPFKLDDIGHWEEWYKLPSTVGMATHKISEDDKRSLTEDQMGDFPLIFPPTLNKTTLSQEPVIRKVWSKAHKVLNSAQYLIFIGYSFPETDITSRFLFSEATTHIDHENMEVIDYVNKDDDQKQLKEDTLKSNYRKVFTSIPDENFYFDGAVDWIKNNIDSTTT